MPDEELIKQLAQETILYGNESKSFREFFGKQRSVPRELAIAFQKEADLNYIYAQPSLLQKIAEEEPNLSHAQRTLLSYQARLADLASSSQCTLENISQTIGALGALKADWETHPQKPLSALIQKNRKLAVALLTEKEIKTPDALVPLLQGKLPADFRRALNTTLQKIGLPDLHSDLREALRTHFQETYGSAVRKKIEDQKKIITDWITHYPREAYEIVDKWHKHHPHQVRTFHYGRHDAPYLFGGDLMSRLHETFPPKQKGFIDLLKDAGFVRSKPLPLPSKANPERDRSST